MDETTLTKWKYQLEIELSDLEKKISALELERKRTTEQLGAINKLLSTMRGEEQVFTSSIKFKNAEEATTEFLAGLKLKGWSVVRNRGRANIYNVSLGNQKLVMWLKFSEYSDVTDHYWFGIDPESLDSTSNQKGGMILILGLPDRYLCLPFTKLLELLKGANKAQNGSQKFHIREKSSRYIFQAGGKDVIDVSSFYNDLSRVGLEEGENA